MQVCQFSSVEPVENTEIRGSFKKFYLLDPIFALENGTHLKFFYNNTFNLWLHCAKISSLYLLYFFLGAPNTPAGFGAPETETK